MAFSKEDGSFLVAFINMVEDNPCLWKNTIKTYNRSEETGFAWKTIAAEFNDTEHNCRERWKNIRCAYGRSLRPPKSGLGTKSKRAYYLAEHLSFLIPYMSRAQLMSGNLTEPSGEENDDNNDLGEPQNDTENESTELLESNLSEEVMSASKTAVRPACLETSQASARPPSEKRRKETPKNDADTALAEWPQMKKQNEKGVQWEDADLMFFQSLMPDLKQLDDRGIRCFKAKTMNLLYSMLDEAEKEASVTPYSLSNSTWD